ncbi:unnamed protein product, partial [Timema podura]|nr:unnamed protein product [Timema podura]
AKQRASVKWLLSKAYNNKVPDNLKEPFYRDHEIIKKELRIRDQEHLKPQIVHSLANAELYCLALSNIYSDPNYHNLNHCGIIQALARKGVLIGEPSDAQLTETVLIQTTPIKLSFVLCLATLYRFLLSTKDRRGHYLTHHILLPSQNETGPTQSYVVATVIPSDFAHSHPFTRYIPL